MSRENIAKRGFTLIELLVVITILMILATLVLLAINPTKIVEKSRIAAATSSLQEIARAAALHAAETGDFAPDVNRNVPQEFIKYLNPATFPSGPFSGSVYDWDNWAGNMCWDGSTGIVQVTLRQINDYKGKVDYTLYYVIQGVGIPHCSNSSTKGECVNCPSRYP